MKQKIFTTPMDELFQKTESDPIKDFISNVPDTFEELIEPDEFNAPNAIDPFIWDKKWLKSIKVEYLGRYSFERIYYRHPSIGIEKPYMTRITVEVRLPTYVNGWQIKKKENFANQCAVLIHGQYAHGDVIQVHAEIKTNRLVKKENKDGIRKEKYPFVILEITYNNEKGTRNCYTLKELCAISMKSKKLMERLAQSFLDNR